MEKIGHKMLAFILALCLVIPASSVFAINGEGMGEVEQSQIEEIKKEAPAEEPKEEVKEEVKTKTTESVKEETVVEENAPAVTKENEEEVAYYTWHSEDEQGNAANPKFVNVNPNVTEEDFETNQSTIVLEAYDKNGNNIKNKNQYIPIDKVERTIEGDIQHPGVNSVVETLTYNNIYSETIYHSLYTFITVNYIEKNTNKVLHNWNYETIGWGFKFSEEDENISTITADMDETEKTNFYNQFYSPHQDTRYKTWNVSEWDKISIDGYDYVETIGAIAGIFADLTQQHNIFVYYQEHIDDPEPIIPGPEPEPTPVTPKKDNTTVKKQTTITTEIYTETRVISPLPTPKAAEPTIEDSKIPLAKPQGTWALFNLILTIISCLIAIILLFVKKKSENDEYTDEEEKDIRSIRRFKIFSILFGIISIIVFIFTEDMTMPMVWVDRWTILMAIFTGIEIANIFIIRQKAQEEEETEEEE